jgi:hypothetical protein
MSRGAVRPHALGGRPEQAMKSITIRKAIMIQELNLEEIEQKAWLTVFRDGLIDLWLGWLLLWWGVMYLVAQTDLSTLVMTSINMGGYTLGLLALYLGKRRIILPRTGRVQFGRLRLIKIAWTGVILFVLVNGCFCLTLYTLSRQESLLGESLAPFVSPLMLGAFFLLLFGLPGLILGYRRLYVVAILFAQGEILRTAVREIWGTDPGSFPFRAAGAAVLITMGLIAFLHFLRTHPVLDPRDGGPAHGE